MARQWIRSLRSLWSAVALLGVGAAAQAQLIPGGDFETPPVIAPAANVLPAPWVFNGTHIGTAVNPLGGRWTSTFGAQFGMMTSARGPGDEIGAPPPYGTTLFPMLAPGAAVPAGILEGTLGVPATSLTGLGAVEGSGFRHSGFVVPAGANSVSFDWIFVSNEPFRVPPFPDFAFYSVDGGLPVILATAAGAANGPLAANTLFGFDNSVGAVGAPWFTTVVPLAPGLHTISFGVVDVGDALMSSALFVDNIAVPEPTTYALIGLASGGAWLYRRYRRKNGAAQEVLRQAEGQ